ncbi:hypothetical protein [uncultured Algibacter sp.]|uniref:hypothetical protein n=1 Tax=uncultured Algibacter sp. TaxID=298659 RepID=UPI003217C81E
MKIQNVYIKFNYQNIDELSDNTLRKLLREYSKLTRNLLLEEIENILYDLELPYRQRQSLKSIIKNKTSNSPNFYVEKIEKGSLIVIGMLTATGYFLLQKSLGKSFEKAWEKSDIGKDTDELMLNSLNKLHKYLKTRPKKLKKLLNGINGKILGDKYFVKSVKKSKLNDEPMIIINIEDIEKPNQIMDFDKIDSEYVEFEIIEEIKKTEEKIKKKKR